jgi:hypothetical protein
MIFTVKAPVHLFDEDLDGVYEHCDLLTDIGELVGDVLQCPAFYSDPDGILPYISVVAQCKTYDNEWVFNIADFVGYLWNLDTTGTYVIQVRFYPL